MSSVDVSKSDDIWSRKAHIQVAIKNVDGRMTGFGAGKGDHR